MKTAATALKEPICNFEMVAMLVKDQASALGGCGVGFYEIGKTCSGGKDQASALGGWGVGLYEIGKTCSGGKYPVSGRLLNAML
ncbi:MAG: hypothetical protein EOO53_19905 [Gammaproteobacteria bacterium]|nr:MAG: hypothetical protein EOO53_19905 [Gammaproteobacteria bacterium]